VEGIQSTHRELLAATDISDSSLWALLAYS
jgi:hypothetical protein